MQSPSKWLTKLKAIELHRLAVLIGTPCSGTKDVLVNGIQNALASFPNNTHAGKRPHTMSKDVISLVSIDVGICNLAYSHWTTNLVSATGKVPAQYARPLLQQWQKVDISSSSVSLQNPVVQAKTLGKNTSGGFGTEREAKESFEPIDYAKLAYDFVKNIFDKHNPTHVVIERQRFRSGGNSAVQEWTIRVGVFEGMLYAVLRSFAEERRQYRELVIEPILPARVNRYWLEELACSAAGLKNGPDTKRTTREMKKMKIDLVRKLLHATNEQAQTRYFDLSDDVQTIGTTFCNNKITTKSPKTARQAPSNHTKEASATFSKLDDLADCLLQGLAWLHWQNNRLLLEALEGDFLSSR